MYEIGQLLTNGAKYVRYFKCLTDFPVLSRYYVQPAKQIDQDH